MSLICLKRCSSQCSSSILRPSIIRQGLRRLLALILLIDAGADPAIADSVGHESVAITRERKVPEEMIEQYAAIHDHAALYFDGHSNALFMRAHAALICDAQTARRAQP